MTQWYNPLNSNERTWRESKVEATRHLGDALAPVVTALMKTQPESSTWKEITTPYHHDHHQNGKKPPITATWETEEEEETATIMGYP
ncbi:hypothetical protein P8452_23554 [Trifolium repens]|nr:hypothetical protein P8452_23554 [Trifolium repens]